VCGHENRDDEKWTSSADYRETLKFEHELIDRKLTRLLTSQTILFAAFAFAASISSVALIRILAGTGLALCLVLAFGMAGNFRAKWYVYLDYRQMVEARGWRTPAALPVEWGVRTLTTRWGMVADFLVPAVFTAAWAGILIWAGDIAAFVGD
jgi:hypothetical protein